MDRYQALERILEITRLMAATVELDGLLEVIVASAVRLLEAERASILLYDPHTDELISRIAVGTAEIRIPAGTGIAGATIATRQTINVPDAYADPRFNPEVDRHTGFHTRSILSVPLSDFEGALVGVLQILNKSSGPFDSTDEQLATTLAAQAGVALQRARLMGFYREKQAMEKAMEIAREIQRGLLPKTNPEVDDFEIAGLSEPADQTGGDTFDFVPLSDGKWLIVVADASGHGIGPALLITETRAMLRATSIDSVNLGRMLNTANQLLANELDGRFVTCFIGLFDPASRTMTYASAGHGPILFYDRQGDDFREMPATGLPLGLLAQADYSDTVTHTFACGDMCVITTDGFFEACAPNGEMFGVDRMMSRLRRDRDLDAQAMLRNLHEEITDFLEVSPPQDDRTGVIIKRHLNP